MSMKKTTISSRPLIHTKYRSSSSVIGIRGSLTRKCFFLICGLGVAIVIYLAYLLRIMPGYHPSGRSTTAVMFATDPEIHTQKLSCHLPNLNPFDPSILKYTNDAFGELNCTKFMPEIFTTDFDSHLLTLRDPSSLNLTNCCYRPFTRVNEKKIRLAFICYPINEPKMKIRPNQYMIYEYISIECKEIGKSEGKVIDMFGFTPIKSAVEKKAQKAAKKMGVIPDDQLNVVIFGIDGVSHMNFIRTMPLAHKYLTEDLSAIGMNGYNKVGDHTFPNLVAALAGLNESELVSTCWPSDHAYFDDCPFIWKNFSQRGYRTDFAEDAAAMGAFNYQKRGFVNPPTDYYLRTLTNAQAKRIGHTKPENAELCYGPRLGFEVLLQNLKNMAATMQSGNRRYFQLTWATSLFHDHLTAGTHGDQQLHSALKFLWENGHLNSTVLILMSDHGIRWGDIRSTFQGKVEERMPFLYFVFPEWFHTKYPTAVENIRSNSKRLTTHFDLYETLRDLMSLENIDTYSLATRSRSVQQSMPRGISLFLPVPPTRTCPLAGIDDHWCVCHPMESISTKEDYVKTSAAAVVSSLNNLLKKSRGCAQLTLHEIRSAQSSIRLANSLNSSENSVLSLTLSTTPGEAIFEATLMKLGSGDNYPWTVSGDISRINLYREQSNCISDYKLKKYCYCL